MVHDAVCRNLEIIGEAARRFDDAFRLAHAEIPWRAMTDVRNILIHADDRRGVVVLSHISMFANRSKKRQFRQSGRSEP